MHEKIHQEHTKIDAHGESVESRFERNIAAVAEPMQAYALAHPCMTHEALDRAVKDEEFARFLQIRAFSGLYVLLTVSPTDDAIPGQLDWHCSMSIVSSASGRSKSIGLWTKGEKLMVKSLLRLFLKGVGDKSSKGFFIQTATALDFHRELSDAEYGQIYL